MAVIKEIAAEHGLLVVSDVARAHFAFCRNRPLGSLGQLATLRFHETKNVISGEGCTLLKNEPGLVGRPLPLAGVAALHGLVEPRRRRHGAGPDWKLGRDQSCGV
jgi:dTDP-4-amino-4,6-dideoxygalactose transaminase